MLVCLVMLILMRWGNFKIMQWHLFTVKSTLVYVKSRKDGVQGYLGLGMKVLGEKHMHLSFYNEISFSKNFLLNFIHDTNLLCILSRRRSSNFVV